ncbi:MAG TPA: protein phosphatase 2C domain-containing protein [Allosphingosinicella sp.]
MPALRAESGAGSHSGCVRERNEDSFVAREQEGLWAVADGMGGEANGDWASATLVEALGSIPLPLAFEEACEAIPEAISRANLQIYERSLERGRTIGSTVVVLFAQDQRFVVFWAGDSRAYLLRNGALHRISRDHSQVQEMVDCGMLRPEEAPGHPMGHVLARAVGVETDLDLDAVQGDIRPGDVFLLCSDGLHGYVPEADIARLLVRAEPLESVEQLIATTLELGAPDNVTVIAIGFGEPTVLSIGGGPR